MGVALTQVILCLGLPYGLEVLVFLACTRVCRRGSVDGDPFAIFCILSPPVGTPTNKADPTVTRRKKESY